MGTMPDSCASSWRTAPGDLTDQDWELIADLVPTYSDDDQMSRPAVHAKRRIAK